MILGKHYWMCLEHNQIYSKKSDHVRLYCCDMVKIVTVGKIDKVDRSYLFARKKKRLKCSWCKGAVPRRFAMNLKGKKAKPNAKTVYHYACAGYKKAAK